MTDLYLFTAFPMQKFQMLKVGIICRRSLIDPIQTSASQPLQFPFHRFSILSLLNRGIPISNICDDCVLCHQTSKTVIE